MSDITRSVISIGTLARHRRIVAYAPRTPARIDPPNARQRAALIAARDSGPLMRGRDSRWSSHLTETISACRRRGWLTDAPGYETAMKPSWTPVVITPEGRKAIET